MARCVCVCVCVCLWLVGCGVRLVLTARVFQEADTAELADLYSAVLQGAPEVAVDTPLIIFALREAVALGADAAPSDEPVDASLLDWAAQLDTCVPIEEGDASLLGVCRAAQEVGKGPKELLVGEAVADAVEAVPEYAATPVASAVRAVVRQARFPGAPGRLVRHGCGGVDRDAHAGFMAMAGLCLG